MAKLWTPRTPICLGFDGSLNNDWTAIRGETLDGFQFTPKYGPDRIPTYWDPSAEGNGGRIPRDQVQVAVKDLFTRYAVARFYCDPHDWQSEIEAWALEYGDEHVFEWDTGRGQSRYPAVYGALERFRVDLDTAAIWHDGCEQTALHMANCRKIAKPGDRYVLGKPSEHQKIDLSMASVLAHEAASDARGDGWKVEEPPAPLYVWR